MAIAETAAARKLLHGGVAIAQGVADVGGISFGLWDLITGFFANILAYLLAALAGVAHLLVLPLELLWQWLVTIVADAAGAIDGLWQHVTGFFSGIFAALAAAPHLLVLPLEKLWQWLVAAATDAAGSIGSGIGGLWQHVTGFFAALAGAPHLLVLPLEKLWQWLVSTAADAAGAVGSGIDSLWHRATDFFAGIFAALAGAPHLLVLPLEKLWQWLVVTATDAAGAVSSGLAGLWHLVTGLFPGIIASAESAAHELPKKLEELSRWLQAAAAAALPFVLLLAALLLLGALVWFCGAALCKVALEVCKTLVSAVCYFGHGIYFVAVAVHQVLAWLLPPCLNFCAAVTMNAPGAAGMVISRAAFEAAPALYFQILRAAGPVVAAAVFCTKTVALIVAAPVAALFRASVGA